MKSGWCWIGSTSTGAKGAAAELCDRLNLEKSAVYDRRDKALRHFTLALYGVTETE